MSPFPPHEKTSHPCLHSPVEQDGDDPLFLSRVPLSPDRSAADYLRERPAPHHGVHLLRHAHLDGGNRLCLFVIFAALYNLIAQWVGGMEFEVIDVPEEQIPVHPDTEKEALI
jgi:hypothetical protein